MMYEKKIILKKIWAGLKGVGSRTFVFYLFLVMLANASQLEWDIIFKRARLKSLNRWAPTNFKDLRTDVESGRPYSPDKMREFLQYYRKMIEYLPSGADGLGILAFCYYHAGDTRRAIWTYEQARDMMPEFVPFNYNLGVIYFKQGNYQKAVRYLQEVPAIPFEKYLELTVSSKVLLPYFDTGNLEKDIKYRIRDAYANSYQLLILSNYYLKDYAAVVRYANEALSISVPGHEFYQYFLGLTAYEFKKYPEAVALFQAAIRFEPRLIDAYHYLGLSFKALGQKALGDSALKEAVILQGTNGISAASYEQDIRLRLF